MKALFKQVVVPASGSIVDQGVVLPNGQKLSRIKEDTPKKGEYYVNERAGRYIFPVISLKESLSIDYSDTRASKTTRLKRFTTTPT